MTVIETVGLTHRYGRQQALDRVDLRVESGSVYALLGRNGAGKTTLLKILAGLLRPSDGRAAVLGLDATRLTLAGRQQIVYIAEGMRLPGALTLQQLERYLAPLYPSWDHTLANSLRQRFDLDGERRLRTFSRGEQMKAALMCSLAPRPRVLLMDEPFTGMDVVTKDEIVRGVLETTDNEDWTVLITSHDIAELEPLADRVGLLERGRLSLSLAMDELGERFVYVDVVTAGGAFTFDTTTVRAMLNAQQAGPRISFILDRAAVPNREEALRQWFPMSEHVVVRPATLREVFVAWLAHKQNPQEVSP